MTVGPDPSPSGSPAPPAGRYPTESSPQRRRRWLIGLSVLVVVAGVAIAWVGYSRFADPPVSGEGTGYDIVDGSTVDVSFTVTRSDPSEAVACVVRARSRAGDEIGRREVLIPPGDAQQTAVESRVKTTGPPAIGEVFGCTTSVPPYLTADSG
ncbi:DUF4307 domain-containing protein [Williamsia serinedens]|uniref:DUF4307 domain-containing protein n=1 Tax=Williamsia serinedens TaxID=391736 RepID=A0ABT1H3P0_9NOCA|nr:DUF4307 domain-containing protein [Williamsia serinedens]MCP2160447.1 protein of unknown function (DUF4307) [Williamsia serinedens]